MKKWIFFSSWFVLWWLPLNWNALAGTPLEPGFTETTYAQGLIVPTSIRWAPGGSNRLFVTVKAEGVRVIQNGTLLSTPFARFPQLYTESECGVEGVCFDPDYAHNHYVYVFVTISASEQRIVRFTDVNNVGTARTTIIPGLPTRGDNHNGGAIGFGPDGKLYWAVGENGARRGVDGDLSSLAAKIGRANADGTVPSDNPFQDGPGPNNDLIWATGFRNPFKMTFQPRTGLLWLNVVGSTPDGQTDPNTGPGYEQVFIVSAGTDGGYDDYEGNQPEGARYTVPFVRPLLHPVIQYKTNDLGGADQQRALSRIVRGGNECTFSTTSPHPFRVGQAVVVSDAGALNGNYVVSSVPGDSTFKAPASGGEASANGGSVKALVQGGSIVGGFFYESSAWPEQYRGNFFYCDYNSGLILRAQLNGQNRPVQITPFLEGANGVTDAAMGPDGALYYTSAETASVRRVAFENPGVIGVTPSFLNLIEGGAGGFAVRLGSAPPHNVTVSIKRTAGDASLSLTGKSILTFTPSNWRTPQSVPIGAALDANNEDNAATFTVSAPGYPSESVRVLATDSKIGSPVVSTSALALAEGQTDEFQVSLPSAPAKAVTLTVRRTAGPLSVRVLSGGSLVFTPANWNVPRTVRIKASEDSNHLNDSATLTVKGRGYAPRVVSVSVTDNDPFPPKIQSDPRPNAVVGLPFNYETEVIGIPAPVLSLVDSPAGMSLGADGVLIWTPQSLGTFSITLRADNGRKPVAQQKFDLTVTADQPPVAFITRPLENDVISGTNSEFYGGGTDDYGCYKAEFRIDGVLRYTDQNREDHYHINGGHNRFDTTLLSNGPHTLQLTVYDDKNQAGTDTVHITVEN